MQKVIAYMYQEYITCPFDFVLKVRLLKYVTLSRSQFYQIEKNIYLSIWYPVLPTSNFNHTPIHTQKIMTKNL